MGFGFTVKTAYLNDDAGIKQRRRRASADDGDDDDDDDGDEVRRPAIGRADARARDAGGTARDDRRHRDRHAGGTRDVCASRVRRAIERED